MAKLFLTKSEVNSRMVWLYVLQTKAAVDIVEYDENDPEISEANIFKTTPFLIDGHTMVWGSQAVLYYIAEKFSDFHGLGKTANERAKVESIVSWACGSLTRVLIDTFISSQLKEEERLPGNSNKELVELGRHQTNQQLQVLEDFYFTSSRKFLINAEPQFVDYLVFMILNALHLVRFEMKQFPKTASWMAEMKKRSRDYSAIDNSLENGG